MTTIGKKLSLERSPMLIILLLVLITLLLVVLVGTPVQKILASKDVESVSLPFWSRQAISLIFGFTILALSASISFSFFGIDSYPLVILTLSLIAPILLVITRTGLDLKRRNANVGDLSIAVPLILSIYLTRGQWSGVLKPHIHAGNGPDVSQNLMAALSARGLGSTWTDQSQSLNQLLGTSSLRESIEKVFTIPSFRDQAGFDYLVFGTRWTLSIFYSQILRFFGDGAILWETGYVQLLALCVISIVSFGALSILTSDLKLKLFGSLLCVGNSEFLLQYFNGGLSQAFGISGVLGIYFSIILIIKQNEKKILRNFLVLGVSTSSWIILLTTYVDAAFILVIFLLVLMILLLGTKDHLSKQVFLCLTTGGFLSLLLNPVLTYSTLSNLDLRGQSAGNTGIDSNVWLLPSELIGFTSGTTSLSIARSAPSFALGIIITFGFLILMSINLNKSAFSKILLSLSLTLILGFVASRFLADSNYIYHKIGVYLAPAFVVFSLLKVEEITKSQKKQNLSTKLILVNSLLVLFTLNSIISASATSTAVSKQGSTISNEMKNLIGSEKLQERLSEYNYLAPYVLSGNYLGVIGNVHWISKSPNDIDLGTRASYQLRLICYKGDPNCNPSTKAIEDPELEAFGLVQFESPISSTEFSNLSIKERYSINFRVFGMPEIVVPEKFLGGNPYLK